MVISKRAEKILESNIGLTLEQIKQLNSVQELRYVTAKTGKSVEFSKKNDYRKTGRGNALLARRKFTTIEEINTRIDSLR